MHGEGTRSPRHPVRRPNAALVSSESVSDALRPERPPQSWCKHRREGDGGSRARTGCPAGSPCFVRVPSVSPAGALIVQRRK